EALDQDDHLLHVLGGAGIELDRLSPQRLEVLEEGLLEGPGQLLDGQAGRRRLLDDPVVHVGDVHHLPDLVAAHPDVAAKQVVDQKGTGVADVRVVPDGGPAGVHAHLARFQRTELLLALPERVVQPQGHGFGSSSATACAEIPSLRPSAPRPSGEVALTPTQAGSTRRGPARASAIDLRCGCRRGSWAEITASTLTTRQPASSSRRALSASSSRDEIPRKRGSVSGKCSPMVPSAAAPRRASTMACVSTSASEWPTRPRSCGTRRSEER